MREEGDLDTVEKKITELITERLDCGGKLPTEKQMAKDFKVSRTVIREVLSIFEASGVVVAQQGSGRYVKMPDVSTQLTDTWSLLIRAKPSMLVELLEIRALLEVNTLAKAMERVTVDQLQELGRQVALMKEKAARGEEFVQQDRQFHRILYYSTGNVLLEQLLTAFWELYAKSSVEPHHKDLRAVADQHEKILDAFTKHDLALLIQLMKEQFADARYRIVVSLMRNQDATGTHRPEAAASVAAPGQ